MRLASSLPDRADEPFDIRIERAVRRAEDLYDLDGETFLRCRDGRVETFIPDDF
jgi:hypothetical protein